MHIKVYGPGCARCTKTAELIKEMAAKKGADITVEKVSDMKEMMLAGVMATPAVAVDGVMKSTGRIPSNDEIAAWLESAPAL